MDRITKSYLCDFKAKYGFECADDELFEHFCDFTIISPMSSQSITENNLEQINIGINSTIALDGFAILLNKELMTSQEEIEDFISSNRKVSCEVVFIQSKTSQEFDSKEIMNFGDGVSDFISETQKYSWSSFAQEKIKLFSYIISFAYKLSEKPKCLIYYVTLGKDTNDTNVYARKEKVVDEITRQNLFSEISFNLIDADKIQAMYKKLGQNIQRSFEFEKKIVLPETEGVKEAYVGLVDAKTVVSIMTTDDSSTMLPVFYDNVRDFQGLNNKVNQGIRDTIGASYRNEFAILNNGITIVAEHLTTVRNIFTITNYQIINGCQTANVLFQNKDLLDNSIQVVLKLIVSENQDLISRVIRSTNSQTEVKQQDLLAYSLFQKKLEDFYGTFPGKSRLYYERRSKQYETNNEIDKTRIIDKALQMKVVCCFFYDKPHLATRYFGTLFKEFGRIIFNENDNPLPYYLAAYIYYKIERLFKQHQIDPKYRKIKFFLLTMCRYELGKKEYPKFNSKKIVKYCEEIQKSVDDDVYFASVMNEILKKIDGTDEDLSSSEISKSSEFANKCLKFY